MKALRSMLALSIMLVGMQSYGMGIKEKTQLVNAINKDIQAISRAKSSAESLDLYEKALIKTNKLKRVYPTLERELKAKLDAAKATLEVKKGLVPAPVPPPLPGRPGEAAVPTEAEKRIIEKEAVEKKKAVLITPTPPLTGRPAQAAIPAEVKGAPELKKLPEPAPPAKVKKVLGPPQVGRVIEVTATAAEKKRQEEAYARIIAAEAAEKEAKGRPPGPKITPEEREKLWEEKVPTAEKAQEEKRVAPPVAPPLPPRPAPVAPPLPPRPAPVAPPLPPSAAPKPTTTPSKPTQEMLKEGIGKLTPTKKPPTTTPTTTPSKPTSEMVQEAAAQLRPAGKRPEPSPTDESGLEGTLKKAMESRRAALKEEEEEEEEEDEPGKWD